MFLAFVGDLAFGGARPFHDVDGVGDPFSKRRKLVLKPSVCPLQLHKGVDLFQKEKFAHFSLSFDALPNFKISSL